MKRKNTTRNALVSSIISLLLCVSMLVGATFAWFTDEVVSGMNTITAGNLDVELLANGTKVENTTKLFSDVEKWEPGVVAYENLQVVNEGTLALKYQMTLNFGDENNLNGHKLSEVLKVAVIDKVAATATRQEVLAAAKAAVAADKGLGSLSNFLQTGALAAKGKTAEIDGVTVTDKSDEMTVVIFWEPGTAEYDNQFNANNGQKTSDGEPLHIEFGINLQATQQMEEEDSFDETYDKLASFMPKAKVNDLGAAKKNATINGWGNGAAVEELDLPFILQFQPNDTYAQAQSSAYRYWHADFVVKADRDVPANSLALAGYYEAFCGPNGFNINNGNWVALTAGETITAGTEIRLVAAMGGTDDKGNYNIFVNYEEICNYGNDGTGFLCSAADLTGVNAGTTLTVELRVYETAGDPNTVTGPKNEESGKSYVVGTYTYTFPAAPVNNETELNEALTTGVGSVKLAAGEYKMPSNGTATDITISGSKATVIDVVNGAYLENANIVFDGVTIKTGTGKANGNGSDYAALYSPNVTYKNCTFVGPMRVGRDGAKFINCTFTELGNDYIWTYGNDVTFENCTFNTDGKAILVYNDGGNEVANVSVKGCKFVSTQGAKAGAIANQNCAAIEIDNYGNGVNLTTEGNTYDSNFSGEWRIKTYKTGGTQIFVNGTEYTTIAIDGKTMTIDANKNVTVNG